MKIQDLNSILTEWDINDEAERWSLKKQFLQDHTDDENADQFIVFLKQRYGNRLSESHKIMAVKKILGWGS